MKVAVLGGGLMGLCTAALLGGDGHDVVVLERDPEAPPDPLDAYASWERRGVNQFRMAHFFLSRFRATVESELPQLASALAAAGACRYNIVANIPDEMKGGARPGDDMFDCLTGRRAMVEAVAAAVAAGTPGVTIRRGAAVRGLLTGSPDRPGTPHVTGVELDRGEQVAADLVVDTTGRRSPLPRWLEAAGAQPPAEELEDSGFIYYGRHFRSADGSQPAMFAPLRFDYGSITCLTLPADNGTWSVTITASSGDSAMRAVKDPDRWAAVVRLLPLHAHWIDAEPIDDSMAVMTKIEDRIRDYAPGGQPVASGVLALADSWACTNPSLGRGASIGVTHAVALRNLLRRSGSADPWDLAVEWSETTRTEVEPFYRTTLEYDRHRLAEIEAMIAGVPYCTDDPAWATMQALDQHSLADGEVLRANIAMAMLVRSQADVFADRDLMGRLQGHSAAAGDQPPLGPTRAELLATLSA